MLSKQAQVIWVILTPLLAISVSVLCHHWGENVRVSIMVPFLECIGVQRESTVTQECKIVGGWMNWLPSWLTVATEAHEIWSWVLRQTSKSNS